MNEFHPDTENAGPQPMFCDLCGLKRSGSEYLYSDAEGLRGRLICSTTPTCRRYRSKMGWKHRRRLFRPSETIGSGKHPVYPPGATDPFDGLTPST